MNYEIVISKSKAGLHIVAERNNCRVLKNTIRKFLQLVSDDDDLLGRIGNIKVDKKGWVALARKV